MSDEHWSGVYDSARAVRVNAVRPFGFTDRQARFLVNVMAHSGSFLERQYCAFAGIARGQNSRDFVAGLVARGYATAITYGSARRGRIYHIHHKPLYEAIGEPDDRHRKPQTIGRMVQRLMILDGVLGDRNCWWMGTERDKRSYFATTRQTGISAPEYPQIAFGSGPQKTIRYFPDKLPIGVQKRDLGHHVFLYLVTRTLPIDFRMFLRATPSCSACCTPGRFECWSRVGSGGPRHTTRFCGLPVSPSTTATRSPCGGSGRIAHWWA